MEIVDGFLRKFRKAKPIPTSEVSKNQNIEPPQGSSIDSQLIMALQKARVVLQKVSGMPAILETSDPLTPEYFQGIKAKKPDGYLVGVGVGGIFSFLETFSQEPLGIIATDINPHTVAAGRVLVETLRESPDFETFNNNLLTISNEEYESKVKAVARKDSRLAKALRDFKKEIGDSLFTFTPMSSRERSKENKPEDIDVADVIKRNYSRLRSMALEGRIAICFADVSDDIFVKAVRGLPAFDQKTNLIYFSNALWFAKAVGRETKEFSPLRLFDYASHPIYAYSAHSKDGQLHVKTAGSFSEVMEGGAFE